MNLNLTDVEKAYIAGFLDADGCITAQLVKRKDYRLLYQIRFSMTFYQKTSRLWFLIFLQKKLQIGTRRNRRDGVSEYTIVGVRPVTSLLKTLLRFLRIKRKVATLLLKISPKKKKNQTPEDFIKCCELVDQVEFLNDSKKRTITSEVVTVALKTKFVPVETSIPPL